MRVLAITNMYPSVRNPALGTFVQQQVLGLQKIGLEVKVLDIDRVGNGMKAYAGLGRQIRSYMDRFHPDLVHLMYGGVMAYFGTRAISKVPSIVTFHGSDLLGEPLSGPSRRALAYMGVVCSKMAARQAQGIVLVARHLERALPKHIDRSKIRIIPCGIDLARFKVLDSAVCRRQLGWNPEAFHVLFATNGNPIKRPSLAHAAVKALSDKGILAELHQLSSVPYDDVPIWINASDVLLLTSFHEGSPTIVKESLSCNVPIVSVDVGDVAERIEGIAGCCIASAEATDLSDRLFRVYSTASRIEGRVRMRALSLEKIALELRDFYNAVIEYPLDSGNPKI